MSLLQSFQRTLVLSQSSGLMRRYFVVNGFDGALTMLGILVGFYMGNISDRHTILSACFGAAVALFMSGLSAATISESAERKKALADMEQAMIKDLKQSEHGIAARWSPWLIGLVNGLSPFLISLIILLPILIFKSGYGYSPVPTAMSLGLLIMFMLGVFLGRIGGTHWLFSGLKALTVGLVTVGIVLLLD